MRVKITPGFRVKYLTTFCAPIGLVLIACLQLYLVHVHNLVPWKGGGFGMFASVDAPPARFLRCYLLTADGQLPVRVPASLQPLAVEIRALPLPERLSYFAAALAQASAGVEFHSVRVELWRYGFDAGSRQLKAVKILEVTVTPEASGPG